MEVQQFSGPPTIHEAQMTAFIAGLGAKLDDDPVVTRVASGVAAAGARFLHVRIPGAFARLEEHYAPEMHRANRRRYTLEVIRGLAG